jgi:glycosyltransferase involved in cell wall biosynthesis
MKVWNMDPSKVALLPYPYVPSSAMLEIPCGSKGKMIGYFGQMSERKGLRVLGQALPLIFRHHPDARFLFVGKSYGMRDGTPFPDYLRAQAGAFAGQLEFTGQVALKDMPGKYSRVDLCVFPSVWENFPNVCLEAMSAGRAVVASWNGGMAEMLDAGQYGLLFPPNSPEKLAQAVSQLLEQPELCFDLGQRARKRVLECYNREKIAPLQEELYRQAIEMRRNRKPLPH